MNHLRNILISRHVGMIDRCTNPKCVGYKRYGARGITVCQEWIDSPQAFVDWALANGFSPELQIDRIDNDKGYSPENCRWVTPRVNSRNRSCNRLDEASVASIKYLLTLKGIKQKDLAHYFGVDPTLINAVYKQKIWDDVEAIPCVVPKELYPYHEAAMRKEMDDELTKLEYEIKFQQWELRAAHVRYEREVLGNSVIDICKKYGLTNNTYYDIIHRRKFPNIKPLKP